MALTKVGDEVLDLVIPYIYNVDDRNSISLVSHNFYEIDSITRKRIQQLALEFRCLKELHIRGLVVYDKNLKTLARTRGKDLRSLKIKNCKGFLTDGLRHISNYCKQVRTLCLGYSCYIDVKDGIWLHQLALYSTVLEIFKFKNTNIYHADAEDLTLLVKNYCNSLISLKIGKCYLSKLGDAFRYAFRLEHFGGENLDKESDLVGFQLPLNMRSLSIRCLLMCPYLEVLSTSDKCGDKGLQVIGPIALAKGCTNLEYLNVSLGDISNEALECVGKHMKNLRNFHMHLDKKDGTTYKPLNNGLLDIGLLDNGI
ncbi:leucine-rich repeat, cysteine-containing subtype protein [Tanacetum coccineum]